MAYQLDLSEIRINFKFTESSVRHNPNKRTRFLPYTSKFNENKLKDFSQVIGEFFRLIEAKKPISQIDLDETLKKVLMRVSFDNEVHKDYFVRIVRSCFLTDDNQLYHFHPYIFLYLNSDPDNKKLANFLYDVLFHNTNKNDNKFCMNFEPNDVLSKLIFEALPKLDEYRINDGQTFSSVLPQISMLFMKDFVWLLSNSSLFVDHIEKLLKYYYFFYVSQFSLMCQRFLNDEDQKIVPVFFNLEWESISHNRISYEKGWKILETPISTLFSHINCLEFLNHHNQGSKVYFYNDISRLIRDINSLEREQLEGQLNKLMDEYSSALKDVNWDGFKYKNIYNDSIKDQIYKFYKMIDFQFNQVNSRKSQYNRYQEWFVSFCQRNFIKLRGRLGRTLNMNAEYLLFFTKMIIKNEPKIRLKSLFEGFAQRGVLFDRDTQNYIVKYFEAINIIEKKSDSGDAIYVKSFL
ncbi:DNA phosphorothioation-dependent restriction protein DptG [Paenibacillus ehimensis]|uniref:DNA phosphorothioation-dependent restriction protein DptG n=1 Tax=Paenibacillus ehimensis TaxID=79264 RepID=UPI0013E2A798|nr:DNA phosphorothioation-dependent restriction protein DptG [Paenibacillus ehimensis]